MLLLTNDAWLLLRLWFIIKLDRTVLTVLSAQGHSVPHWEHLSNECLEMSAKKCIMSRNSMQDLDASKGFHYNQDSLNLNLCEV